MRIVLFLFTNLLFFPAFAQISVGVRGDGRKPVEIPQEWMEAFKRTTTYFFVRVGEDEWVEELQRELTKAWTVTPIKVLGIAESSDILSGRAGEVSYLMMSSNRVQSEKGNQLHAYVRLMMTYVDGNGAAQSFQIAAIYLHLSGKSMNNMIWMPDFANKAGEYLYSEAEIRTWTKGLLVKNFQYLSTLIDKNQPRWLYEQTRNEVEMKKMRHSTLYVMDHVGIDFNISTAVEKPMKDPKSIFKKYPYKYQLISGEDLSNKLIDEDEPFYYLVYIKSSTDKYAVVYRSDTGEVIYSHYAPMAYKFKDKDMEKLARALKKLD